MKFYFVFILLLLAVLSLLYACNDEPSSIGIEILESDYIIVKTFDSQIDSIEQNSSFFKRIVPLGSSDWILLGKNNTAEQSLVSSTLLKFIFGFADSIKSQIEVDSINVLDSWVVLTNKYVYGDTLSTMSFTTHKVNSSWSSSSFTIEDLPELQYDSEDIGSNISATDTLYTFHLDPNVVYPWMQNSVDTGLAKNYGIYIVPTLESNKIIGFQALTLLSSEAAKLFVVIEKPGAYIDTVDGYVSGDISVFDGTEPTLPEGLICAQSSVVMNSKLNFDIGVLPVGLVINKAELILTVDTINTVHGSSYANSLNVYYLSTFDSIKTEGSAISLRYKDNSYSGDITTFVRSWVSKGENFGMLIQSGNQILGADLFALKGSNYSDESVRPRIKVTYTVKRNL